MNDAENRLDLGTSGRKKGETDFLRWVVGVDVHAVANPTLRGLMRAYFYALPAVTLLVVIFDDWIARATALE